MNYLFLALLISAFGLIQCLIGGTRLLFSFPSYCILGACGVLTLFCAARRPKERPESWCLLVTLGYFAYILGRAYQSPIEYLARSDFFMVLGCLLVYFLTAFFLTTTRDRLIVIVPLYILVGLHLYAGCIQFGSSSSYMLFGFFRNDDSFRASGLYISGNHMSGFLEAMGVIALSLMWWSRWPVWAKVILGYLAVACYFGVAISASRGGMLSSVFSVLVLLVLGLFAASKTDRAKFLRTLLIGTAITAIGLVVASNLALRSSLIRARLNQPHTSDIRIYNWQATLDQFRVAPIIGTGSGTHLYYGRLFRRPQIQSDPVHAHGDYLELLAEYGAIGLGGMVVFVFFHLKSGFRAFNFLTRRLRNSFVPRSNTFALNIGVISAVFGLITHSVVDFNMHIPANALLFAFFFGILCNPGIASEREWGLLERVVFNVRFLLPILGIAVWIWIVPKYPGEYLTEQSRVALRDKRYIETIKYAQRSLGETYDDSVWIDRLNKRFGGEKKNPYTYFYLGEANRCIGAQMFNKVLRRTYLAPAAAAYRKGLEIFPEDENTLVRLGQAYDGLEQFAEAEKVFQKAIQIDPNLSVIYTYYADHLKLQGKTADIEKIAAKAKELAKQNIVELGTGELISRSAP